MAGGAVNSRLVGVSGPLKGSRFALGEDGVAVGRDTTNQLSVSDPALSRRQCIIIPSDGGYIIRDLKSRNGTIVNGVPVEERRLEPGDQILIGNSVMVFLQDDQE